LIRSHFSEAGRSCKVPGALGFVILRQEHVIFRHKASNLVARCIFYYRLRQKIATISQHTCLKRRYSMEEVEDRRFLHCFMICMMLDSLQLSSRCMCIDAWNESFARTTHRSALFSLIDKQIFPHVGMGPGDGWPCPDRSSCTPSHFDESRHSQSKNHAG